ncbi:MAG: hypothetical protein EOO01_17545 [Chitinophagaceae bacterium]|nr:MAG: hypothetical protein EOO01_17545 [Chitinophagaceae bacterium]
MNLTPQQTEQLFLFTKKKMVHYYDLQVELVDHLANMIEDLIKENPTLDFETALKKAYSTFGLFGFAHIVQEKGNALHTKYKKMWWKEMKNQFKWPEILLSVLILSITWMLVNVVQIEILATVFVSAWAACWIIQTRLIRQPLRNGKSLLMLQYDPVMNSVFLLFMQIVGWSFIYSKNPYLATTVFVTGAIIEIATFRLFLKIRKEAKAFFPEAFLKPA